MRYKRKVPEPRIEPTKSTTVVKSENIDVKLLRFKWVLLKALSEKEIDAEINFSLHWSFVSDDIAVRAHGFVWAEEESVQRKEIKYPADWWQHLKQRWLPQWALKRWPVNYTSVVLDAKCIYPAYKPKLTGQEHRIIIQKFEHEKAGE